MREWSRCSREGGNHQEKLLQDYPAAGLRKPKSRDLRLAAWGLNLSHRPVLFLHIFFKISCQHFKTRVSTSPWGIRRPTLKGLCSSCLAHTGTYSAVWYSPHHSLLHSPFTFPAGPLQASELATLELKSDRKKCGLEVRVSKSGCLSVLWRKCFSSVQASLPGHEGRGRFQHKPLVVWDQGCPLHSRSLRTTPCWSAPGQPMGPPKGQQF